MNFELMAKILIEKYNSRFTADLIKNLAFDEAENLINNFDNTAFLRKIAFELEKDLESRIPIDTIRLKFRGAKPFSGEPADKSISMEEYYFKNENAVKDIINKLYCRMKFLETSSGGILPQTKGGYHDESKDESKQGF
jgi:hypothetical protein